MASMPMDQERSARGGGKPPISAHPAFPAIVALWFAALFGLGSLILPVQLIERLVSATGIASVISAAAPPLGFTARLAIALVATIFGALLGVVAARRLASRQSTSADFDHEPSGRRLLNPHDDIDDDGIEAEEYYPEVGEVIEEDGARKRRRALAMEENEGPSEFLTVAPLPGVPDESDAADFDLVGDTLELEEVAEDDVESESPVEIFETEPEARQVFGVTDVEYAPDDAGSDEAQANPFAFEDRSRTSEPLAFSPPSMARQEPAQTQEAPRPFDAPDQVEAEEPDNTANGIMPDEPQEDPVSDQQTFHPVPQSFAAPEVDEVEATETAVDPVTDGEAIGEGEEIGLVQLVQKLESTLEKHREWSAQRAAEASVATPAVPVEQAEETEIEAEAAPAIPQEFEAARPDDAAEAMAAYFSKPASDGVVADDDASEDAGDSDGAEQPFQATPVAGQGYVPLAADMRIDDEDEDEDEIADLAASFSLPLARNASSTQQPVTPAPRPSFDIPPPGAVPTAKQEDEGDADGEATNSDATYGALSAVDNPFKQAAQEFVRIDEPEQDDGATQPAVVFPNEQARSQPAPAVVEDDTAAANVARPFDRPADAAEKLQSASNDDNERALREALMNLQRMGK